VEPLAQTVLPAEMTVIVRHDKRVKGSLLTIVDSSALSVHRHRLSTLGLRGGAEHGSDEGRSRNDEDGELHISKRTKG
jgi:hypothetical protein